MLLLTARSGTSLLGAFCLAFGAALSAGAGEVKAVRVDATPAGTRAEIELAGTGEYKTISLAGPDRLVVDLPASTAARNLVLPPGAGMVRSVRTGQPVAGTVRIVFDLAGSAGAGKPRMQPTAGGATLVLEWEGATPVAAANPVATPAATAPKSTLTAAEATALLTAAAVRQANQPRPLEPEPVPQPQISTPSSMTRPVPAQSVTSAPAATAPMQVAKPSPADILNGRVVVAGPTATSTLPAVEQNTPEYTVATGVPAPMPDTAASLPQPPTPVLPPQVLTKAMRPLVIAIDAGHGGQDPGAVGPSGTHDKNVVLAIARELARRIDATPGMKSYLVRDGDHFLPLPQRAAKARAAKADMFVSIHADAAENRNARGSSVYVLSLKGASSQRARWLANKENASDLIGGVRLKQVDNTLSSVLLDLAQSGHMKASEDAANHVLDGLKRVGNNHKPHIERANFAVLRTSDMPAMLVETAFISNHDEEKRLMDPAYQRKVAGAVLDGVQTYFTRQPPPGTLFAARAQAEAAREDSIRAAGSP
jgi:N-acetylmuramoyl-L-alanine amidase